MKKIKIAVVLILILVNFTGCTNSLADKAVEQGKLALANLEYDKALGSFELAIDEGSKDKEIKIMVDIIKEYKKSLNLFKKGETENSKRIISNINKDYSRYTIKEEIENLNESIDSKIKKDKVAKYRKEHTGGEDPDFMWKDAEAIITKIIGPPDETVIYNGRMNVHMDDNGRKFYTIWTEDPNASCTAEGTIAMYDVFEDGTVTPH